MDHSETARKAIPAGATSFLNDVERQYQKAGRALARRAIDAQIGFDRKAANLDPVGALAAFGVTL